MIPKVIAVFRETEDLSTHSVLHAIGMEDQYNFVIGENQVAHFIMRFVWAGPVLVSSSMWFSTCDQDFSKLKEHSHMLKGLANKIIQ